MLVDDDSGPRGQTLDPGADLLDDADRLMAGDSAHAIPELIGALPIDMEVAPAHGRHRRAHQHPSAARLRCGYVRQLCPAIAQDA
jgi:hypothetical protein